MALSIKDLVNYEIKTDNFDFSKKNSDFYDEIRGLYPKIDFTKISKDLMPDNTLQEIKNEKVKKERAERSYESERI